MGVEDPVDSDMAAAMVIMNARGWRESDVIRAISEEFEGAEVGLATVRFYNPTTIAGRRLTTHLRKLFYKERRRWEQELVDIPIYNKAFRLASLQFRHDNAGKNSHLALDCLKLARIEAEGDRVVLQGTGKNGAILTEQQGLNTSQAAAVLSAIIESAEQRVLDAPGDDVLDSEMVDNEENGGVSEVTEGA
jgi:hypothetical protein